MSYNQKDGLTKKGQEVDIMNTIFLFENDQGQGEIMKMSGDDGLLSFIFDRLVCFHPLKLEQFNQVLKESLKSLDPIHRANIHSFVQQFEDEYRRIDNLIALGELYQMVDSYIQWEELLQPEHLASFLFPESCFPLYVDIPRLLIDELDDFIQREQFRSGSLLEAIFQRQQWSIDKVQGHWKRHRRNEETLLPDGSGREWFSILFGEVQESLLQMPEAYLSETEIMHHVAKGEISLINVFGEDKVKDCQQKMKFLKTMKYRASIRLDHTTLSKIKDQKHLPFETLYQMQEAHREDNCLFVRHLYEQDHHSVNLEELLAKRSVWDVVSLVDCIRYANRMGYRVVIPNSYFEAKIDQLTPDQEQLLHYYLEDPAVEDPKRLKAYADTHFGKSGIPLN